LSFKAFVLSWGIREEARAEEGTADCWARTGTSQSAKTVSKHKYFETRFIARFTPFANLFAALWDGLDGSMRNAAFGMRNYTRLAGAASFENLIASIYFSDAFVPKRIHPYEFLISFRFTSLTNLSASRVGRGMRTPSLTAFVKRTADSSDMRCPCET